MVTPAFLGYPPPLDAAPGADYDRRVRVLDVSVRAFVATGDGIALIPALAAARPFPATVTKRMHGEVPLRAIHLARAA